MLRIGFSGAQGTGKSTIAAMTSAHYSELGRNVLSIKDPVRAYSHVCQSLYRKAARNVRSLFDMEFFALAYQYLNEAIAQNEQTEMTMYDGCPLDHYVYWRLLSKLKEGPERLSEESRVLGCLFHEQIRRFDVVFLFEVPLPQWSNRGIHDGMRSTDPAYYRVVSAMFRQVAREENLKVEMVPNCAPIKEVSSHVIRVIDQKAGGEPSVDSG